MIVRALSFSPSVLVLDEPTCLARPERDRAPARRSCAGWPPRGSASSTSRTTSRRYSVGDRVTVLKDGRHVATRTGRGQHARRPRPPHGRARRLRLLRQGDRGDRRRAPARRGLSWARPPGAGLVRGAAWRGAGLRRARRRRPHRADGAAFRRPAATRGRARHRRPDRQAAQPSRSRGGRALPRHRGPSATRPPARSTRAREPRSRLERATWSIVKGESDPG